MYIVPISIGIELVMKKNNYYIGVKIDLALSALGKIEFTERREDEAHAQSIKDFLDRHPHIREIADKIILARKQPDKASELLTAYKLSAKKNTWMQSEDDVMTMMLGNAVFSLDNQDYLSPEVKSMVLSEASLG